MNRITANLLLLCAAAIWGLAFVFQKTAMEVLGPWTFIASRAALATLALLPVAIYEAHRAGYRRGEADTVSFAPPGLLRAGIFAGVAFFAGATLQQIGLKTATATNGGFLTALYVIITPVLAWVLLRRVPGIALLPAILLSFAGTWALGGGSIGTLSTGDRFIAACAIFWALHVILSEKGSAFRRPVMFTAFQFAVVATLASIGAFTLETPTLAAMKAASGEILYVGLLSSALTFTLLTVALRYTASSEAAVDRIDGEPIRRHCRRSPARRASHAVGLVRRRTDPDCDAHRAVGAAATARSKRKRGRFVMNQPRPIDLQR